MKIYVLSYHGDVQSDLPAFVSKKDAEKFQREQAKGCFVEEMELRDEEDHIETCRCEVCRFWS